MKIFWQLILMIVLTSSSLHAIPLSKIKLSKIKKLAALGKGELQKVLDNLSRELGFTIPKKIRKDILDVKYNIDPARSANTYRIMTYNIMDDQTWKNRLPLVWALIITFDPDIIGMQELGERGMRDLRKALGERYASFGELNYKPTLKIVRATFGTRDTEYNPIFYNKNRFTLIEQGTFWLNKDRTK